MSQFREFTERRPAVYPTPPPRVSVASATALLPAEDVPASIARPSTRLSAREPAACAAAQHSHAHTGPVPRGNGGGRHAREASGGPGAAQPDHREPTHTVAHPSSSTPSPTSASDGKDRSAVTTAKSITTATTTAAAASGGGGGEGKRRLYANDDIAAAAAEARQILQQPRYVALAEEEQRAREAAQRSRLSGRLEKEAREGEGESPKMEFVTGGPLRREDRVAAAAAPETPSPPSAGDTERAKRKPRRSAVADADAVPPGRKSETTVPADAEESTVSLPKAPAARRALGAERRGKIARPLTSLTSTAPVSPPSANAKAVVPASAAKEAPPRRVTALAEDAVARQHAQRAKDLRTAVATLKALLHQYGMSTSVVPVKPLDESSVCDYCILFADRASVEQHLAHVVRALCVAGMKVIYNAPVEKTASTATTGVGAGEAGKPTTEETDTAGMRDGEGESESEVEMRRRLRSLYCFSLEVVPVSGNAEVVSLHVSIRDGMHGIFYKHYAEHFNRVGAEAVVAGGGEVAVDEPFPANADDLTDAHKKRLLYLVLSHLIHEKAAVPLDQEKVTLFPTHVDSIRDAIWSDCVGSAPWKMPLRLFQGADEAAIACYFGEETMFYFAWMNHYQRWLAVASVLSVLACFFVQPHTPSAITTTAEPASSASVMVAVLNPGFAPAAAVLAVARRLNGTVISATAAAAASAALQDKVSHAWRDIVMTDAHAESTTSLGSLALTHAARSTLQEYTFPLFITAMIIGSVLCIKMWERRCKWLCMRFHVFQPQSSTTDEIQPRFKGKKTLHPITNVEELQFPGWIRGVVLQPFATAMITLFAAGTIAIMIAFVNLEGYTAYDEVTGTYGFAAMPALRRLSLPGAIFNKADHPMLSFVPTLLYTVCISILSSLFSMLAEKLTIMENYKYRGDHIRALTQKRIVFEFINSYAKLFFLALVRQSMTDLSASLKVIFYTAVFKRLLLDTAIPFLHTHREKVIRELKKMRVAKSYSLGKQDAAATAVAVTSKMAVRASDESSHGGSSSSALDEADERLEGYEVYSDYIEMAIQFGYIVLFAVAFPLAPLVAFLSNAIEVRSDLFKLCYVVRRPVPRLGVKENGTWVGIFRGIAFAAVVTNVLLFAVSAQPMIARYLPSCFAYRYETHYTADRKVVFAATPTLVEGMGRYAVLSGVVVEHLVLGVAMFLFWRISAYPKQVRVYMEKRQYDRMRASTASAHRK